MGRRVMLKFHRLRLPISADSPHAGRGSLRPQNAHTLNIVGGGEPLAPSLLAALQLGDAVLGGVRQSLVSEVSIAVRESEVVIQEYAASSGSCGVWRHREGEGVLRHGGRGA